MAKDALLDEMWDRPVVRRPGEKWFDLYENRPNGEGGWPCRQPSVGCLVHGSQF